MKPTYRFFAIVSLFLPAAAAQDDSPLPKFNAQLADMEKSLRQAKVLAIGGAVMGPAVKNAPYSAVEVTESTQMLADGNRIHREAQAPVYRDSEGRVRRENSPDQITIWDPVANASYMLDSQTKTARQMPLSMQNVRYAVTRQGPGERVVTYKTAIGLPPFPEAVSTAKAAAAIGMNLKVLAEEGRTPPKSESLGKQLIEGVTAEGTRLISTIEAGAIGNDQALVSTSETWYSPDLQTIVKSVHTDPRTGEDTFRLVNISRTEPPATLFEVPADYQVVSMK